MTLSELLSSHAQGFSDHDLAVLADWASDRIREIENKDWKRPYALIREGADLLLRRRARSEESIPATQGISGISYYPYTSPGGITFSPMQIRADSLHDNPRVETKRYSDGTVATGIAPLPEKSPAQQEANYALSQAPNLSPVVP